MLSLREPIGTERVDALNAELRMVREFHVDKGVIVNDYPTIPDVPTRKLRQTLIQEEAAELVHALHAVSPLPALAKEICDLTYVSLGTAVSYGITDIDRLFAEVHRSNMTKEGNMRLDGKIIKGASWVPPDLWPLLQEQLNKKATVP